MSSRRTLRLAFLLAALPAAALAARSNPVEIRVVAADQTPIAGATVQVTAESGEEFTTSGVSDAAGVFALEIPDTRRSFRIEASHGSYQPYAQSIDLKGQRAQRGKPLGLTLVLEQLDAADHFNAGVELLRREQIAEAESKFQKAVELDSSMAQAWSVLALIALEGGRHAEAVERADRALALAAADMVALRTRYEALSSLGRDADAEQALSTLYEKDKTEETARLLFNAGAEAANAGQTERATLRLGQALEIDPKLWQAHSALAEIAIREERLEDALAELDKAIGITPRNFKAWERKIEVLRALGREEDAVAAEAHVAGLRNPG